MLISFQVLKIAERERVAYFEKLKIFDAMNKMAGKNFFFGNLLLLRMLLISNGSNVHMIRAGLTYKAAWEQILEICPQVVTKANRAKYTDNISRLLEPLKLVSNPNRKREMSEAGLPTQVEIDEKVAIFCKLEQQVLEVQEGDGEEIKLSGDLYELPSDDDVSAQGQKKLSFESLNKNFMYILFIFGFVCGLLVAQYFVRFPVLENKTKMNLRRPEL